MKFSKHCKKRGAAARMQAFCAISIVVALFGGGSRAQNARADAMGGISILNDFSHVLYNPASINDFPDQLAGSAGSYTDSNGLTQDYFGPMLGKLSVGKTFNIGFIANTVNTQGSSVLRGAFYKQARLFYLQNTGDTLPAAFPMIPHALLGLDFENADIGVEGFYEAARYQRSVTGSDRHRDEGIYNYGAKLNANITIDNWWLCPLIGFGYPAISGETKDSALHAFGSDKAAYLNAGMEIGATLAHATLVAGIYGTNETFSLRRDQTAGPAYTSLFYDGYVGCETYPYPGFLIAVQYDLSLEFDDVAADTLTRVEYRDTYQFHAVRAGVERTFSTTGIFESIVPRAGMVYSFSTYHEQAGDTVTSFPLYSGGMQLNAGLGVTKDMFHLDLFVNIGNWNGIVTGPRAAAITLTIGLSKKFLEK